MSSTNNATSVVIGSNTRNGRALNRSASESVGGLNGFRALGRKKRALLAKGAVLEFFNDSQAVVATMPIDLFYALSDNTTVLTKVDGVFRVQLPVDALDVAVKDLVTRVSKFTDPKVDVSLMDSTGNLYKDIEIASAAEYLGLDAYTQRMFSAHYNYFSNDLVSPAEITAVCKLNTPLGDKLINQVVYNMADRSWKAELPNKEGFAAYLLTNERFGTAINALYIKWEADQASAEASHKAFLGREERREAAAQASHQAFLVREERRQANAKRDTKLAADNKALAAAGESVREKMRHAGSKYTALEARYIWTTFGKRVPVAPGK